MAQIQGKAVLFGTRASASTAPVIAFSGPDGVSITAYKSPIISVLNLRHVASKDTVVNEGGDTLAVIVFNEHIECTLELVPAGVDRAEARAGATVPPGGSTATITGADVIACGPFSDAINVTAGDPGGNKWIYEGDGVTPNLRDSGHGTVSITLRRYPKIVGGTAILA